MFESIKKAILRRIFSAKFYKREEYLKSVAMVGIRKDQQDLLNMLILSPANQNIQRCALLLSLYQYYGAKLKHDSRNPDLVVFDNPEYKSDAMKWHFEHSSVENLTEIYLKKHIKSFKDEHLKRNTIYEF